MASSSCAIRAARRSISPVFTYPRPDIAVWISILVHLLFADELLYSDRPSRAKYQVQEGDLLVSNVRPTRGAITLVSNRRAGALASSGFSLLRDKKLKGAPQTYLFAFLKSTFGRT